MASPSSRYRLEAVEYLPSKLGPGVLYHSGRFRTAAHLCACGCGAEVVTPIKPGEWRLQERGGRPTLNPSVGNWNLPCRSHYWITDGRVRWARPWSREEIEEGRKREHAVRERVHRKPLLKRFFGRLAGIFRRK